MSANSREWNLEHARVASPGSGLRVFMSGVAHGAELGHEEVVAPVVRGRVLLDVGKLHKLEGDIPNAAFNHHSRPPPASLELVAAKAAHLLTAEADG